MTLTKRLREVVKPRASAVHKERIRFPVVLCNWKLTRKVTRPMEDLNVLFMTSFVITMTLNLNLESKNLLDFKVLNYLTAFTRLNGSDGGTWNTYSISMLNILNDIFVSYLG